MAIQLQNSMFIHIPKTGGRWVKHMIQSYVQGYQFIGDPIYQAHESPDTDLPVFAFVRHPITMINSLWHHRSRKHSNKRHKEWNWQQDINLERLCGDPDYHKFFDNIANTPGIITDYYWHFTGKYGDNCVFGKMENIADNFISILDYFKEDYDIDAILASANTKIGHVKNDIQVHRDVLERIMENEDKFCKQFGYTIEDIYNG